MSLSHSSFSFFSNPAGVVEVVTPHETPIVIGQFFGVIGEAHIVGEPYGTELACDYWFQDYATIEDMRDDKKTLEGKIGKLTGTLTNTILTYDQTFQECTFLGFQPVEAPWRDGSGVHGWVQRGRLLWRQRRRG